MRKDSNLVTATLIPIQAVHVHGMTAAASGSATYNVQRLMCKAKQQSIQCAKADVGSKAYMHNQQRMLR